MGDARMTRAKIYLIIQAVLCVLLVVLLSVSAVFAEGETADAYIESLVTQIGSNYNLRVATSDSLVQLSSLRSGVLRVSARELRQEVEAACQDMRKYF
jgi:predicted RNA-binding protein with PIN domain